MIDSVALVVIGRNEGERLKRCLRSASGRISKIVYVDSGSTDGSVAFAQSFGAEIVSLDQSIPFTAARARNAGFAKVLALEPDVNYVQFIDGDCELNPLWISSASEFLDLKQETAAVCGRRRERYPTNSIYNQLCDWEWAVPSGPAKYCGGDVMIRAKALDDVGGYRDSLIAGEEPELCVRLRAHGWEIYVLDKEMTLHDAAMHRFSQWWKRTMRSGYAYAAGAWLHGRKPEHHWVRQCIRAWIWAIAIPAFSLSLAPFIGWKCLLVFLVYPLQILRLTIREPDGLSDSFLKAFFNTISRFPEAIGQMQFIRDMVLGRSQLIEYK